MSFITSNSTFISFADYQNVVDRDSRIFDENEILNDTELIEDILIRASERLLARIKSSGWWREYHWSRNPALSRDPRLVPDVNPMLILGRNADFTDLTVLIALSEYILPKVTDFATDTAPGVLKIDFYKQAATALFLELIESGDWYDYDASGLVTTAERSPNTQNLVRIR